MGTRKGACHLGICSFLTEDRFGGRKGMRLSELRRYVLQRAEKIRLATYLAQTVSA